MIIYHGTAERHLESIIKNGIKPRGKTKEGNWHHSVTSNPRAVYLTTTYALHFAGNACQMPPKVARERMVVLEIETDLLSPFMFAPDEDFLEQATREVDYVIQDQHGNEMPKWSDSKNGKGNMIERTMWFRKRALPDFSHLWEKSTEHMGTCCYYGTIEPYSIKLWAFVPRSSPIDCASDPTVSPLNY